MRIVTYSRVSTEEQKDGWGLESQTQLMQDECDRRGWVITGRERDIASGKDTIKRPAVRRMLHDLDAGVYDGLMVAKLDRLSRSVAGFASIMERSQKHDWALVCLDPPVDLSTAAGRMCAGMISVFAQFEREIISARTREALAAAKARGVHIGSKPRRDPETIHKILEMREAGMTFQAIADALTAEGVVNSNGQVSWSKMVPQRVCRDYGRQDEVGGDPSLRADPSLELEGPLQAV